jgi:hypothetical protein
MTEFDERSLAAQYAARHAVIDGRRSDARHRAQDAGVAAGTKD